jgi:hypothetical protein
VCPVCFATIGEPMRHTDERLAFAMYPDSFVQKINEQ